MKQLYIFASPVSIALGFFLFQGCAGTPQTSEESLSSEEHRSRKDFFRYRIPAGWVDATGDTQSASQYIWLVSQQHAASIAVNELFLDDDVRELIQGEGMLSVATLMMNLAEKEQAAATTQGPSSFRQGDLACWTFECNGPSGDTLRVVLFRIAERCFEVRAWKKADSSLTFRDVSSAQKAFLGSLRW